MVVKVHTAVALPPPLGPSRSPRLPAATSRSRCSKRLGPAKGLSHPNRAELETTRHAGDHLDRPIRPWLPPLREPSRSLSCPPTLARSRPCREHRSPPVGIRSRRSGAESRVLSWMGRAVHALRPLWAWRRCRVGWLMGAICLWSGKELLGVEPTDGGTQELRRRGVGMPLGYPGQPWGFEAQLGGVRVPLPPGQEPGTWRWSLGTASGPGGSQSQLALDPDACGRRVSLTSLPC